MSLPEVSLCDASNVERAFYVAKTRTVRQLWFDGSWPFDRMVPEGLKTSKRQSDEWMSVWDKKHFVDLVFPNAEGSSSPFKGLTGEGLMGQVESFVRATRMYWNRTGAISSDSWLRLHYVANGTLGVTELPEIGLDANLEGDLQYVSRTLTSPYDTRAYCHAFDCNGTYLSAASSLPLPVGRYDYWTCSGNTPPAGGDFANLPGYWRGISRDRRWLTTPAMRYAMEKGATGPVEGYYWPDHHRYLEPWYRMLRDARTKLLASDPHGAALQAVKAIYRQGIGRLGSTRRDNPSTDPLYQPYWRQAVQAEARTRLQRRIDSLSQKPIAVGDVDTLWFLTDNKSPHSFAEQAGLPLGSGLGKFKWKNTLDGDYVREILSMNLEDSQTIQWLDGRKEKVA